MNLVDPVFSLVSCPGSNVTFPRAHDWFGGGSDGSLTPTILISTRETNPPALCLDLTLFLGIHQTTHHHLESGSNGRCFCDTREILPRLATFQQVFTMSLLMILSGQISRFHHMRTCHHPLP